MKRLLIYFSYLGTNYKGLQRLVSNNALIQRAPDLETVQGILEFGLQKIFRVPNKIFPVITSSRTDTKVHAIESTVHVNIEDSDFNKVPYSPEKICQSLNFFLDKNECDIRVRRVVEVPTDFHCRQASSRVYEFRVAVLNEDPITTLSYLHLSSATNIKELNRCEVVRQPFDIRLAQDACKLFLGTWDFSTFMASSGRVKLEESRRIKTIKKFSISPETIKDPEWDSAFANIRIPPYEIYNFTVEGSGFLRRQVRRMVGALVGIGRGVIGPKDILWMLQNPSEQNWNSKVLTLGPNGLYLKQIHYSNLEVLRGYLS